MQAQQLSGPSEEGATYQGERRMAAFHQATEEMNTAYLEVRNMAVDFVTYGRGSIEEIHAAIMALPQRFIDALSVAIPFEAMRATEDRIAGR